MTTPSFRHWFLSTLLLFTIGSAPAADVEADVYSVGVAEVDITPSHPIRLNGFGFRRTESEGVNHKIHARALSIQHKADSSPVVIITTDVLGIPAWMREEIEKRLLAKANVFGHRLAITATHTHCGPMLKGANPTIFGVPIPDDHLKHIDEYAPVFLDKVEAVALAAIKNAKPSKIHWGIGSVGFAKNRRSKTGTPLDHDLPILVVRDAATNKVTAVYTTYACHCVTLSHNKIGGDWAGYAAEAIRDQFPDAVALISVGCGADQNPDSGVVGDKVDVAQAQGRAIATEVKRLVGGFLAPVRGRTDCAMKTIRLPLAELPARAVWEEKAKRMDAIGHHARVTLAKLDRNEKLPTSVPVPVQSIRFGDSLAMIHIGGEVVVDYSIRLKAELDRTRVWITAYANMNPCYIPSERVLKEGGYEGGGAMIYYDLPVPFQPGLEEVLIKEAKKQATATFVAKSDPKKTNGEQPKPPQQSGKAIRVDSAFAVDLVAAEPLVSDPVAIAFGPDGKVWAAEMLDYPAGASGKFEPGGRVRFLEDADGDGILDRATTFVEGLPFPTGVLPWRKGVLICAAPDILYAEDTNGDGKADVVKKLFSGFGTDNYQARVNGLAYGLDGWVHGSCGLFGGRIVSHLTGKTIALGDRDFRIKPDTGEMEPATGRTQQGRVRDDWGHWFGCDNSNFGWHLALDDRYLRRNPHVSPPATVVNLMGGPEPRRVFPIADLQLFKLSGGGGLATAACGIGVYRDDRLGASMTGNTFTCEPVNLLVTRRVVAPNGSLLTATRAANETDREFLASTDRWFRPVQAITGPDGGLWVADMYRFIIEHPRWIPPADLANLDARAGAGLGRLYRVRQANQPLKTWPRLNSLDAAGLVAALDSPNGWQRDMATELLAWRNEKAAIPALTKLATESKRAEARLHALVALDRLGGLTPDLLAKSLTDSHAGIRQHAVRLSESFVNENPNLASAVQSLVEDGDVSVRLQVAYSLGEWKDAKAGDALAQLVQKHGRDSYLLAAAISSLNRDNFRAFVERPEFAELAGTSLLPKLIATATGLGDRTVMTSLLAHVTKPKNGRFEAWQFAALEALLDAASRGGKVDNLEAEVAPVFVAAMFTARDAKADVPLRVAAVRALGRSAVKDDAVKLLAPLLVPQTPVAVQSATITALERIGTNGAADSLLKGWSGYSPTVQAQVMSALLSREAWLNTVFAAVANRTLPASAIPAGPRQGLLTHPNLAIRAEAQKVFAGTLNFNRQQVIDAYRKEMLHAGNAERGAQVFGKTCSVCHQLKGVGHVVGPDLAALANKTSEYLLAEILDPNRNLDNRYLEYTANTADGRSLVGLLAQESSASITLRQAEGKETTLLRADLDSLKAAGRSLMPEGLEKDVSPTQMADLLAYIGSVAAPPKKLAGNVPKVVTPTDGALTLRAADCEIYGGEIVFEPDFGNIGFWHGAKDHVTWRIESKGGEFDVYLDYACDAGSAGNPFALDGVDPPLKGAIVSTGAWSKYEWRKIGTAKLTPGSGRVTVRSDADAVRGALMDLRTVLFFPKGAVPKFTTVAPIPVAPEDAAGIAKYLLTDTRSNADREALLAKHADQSVAILRELAADIPEGKEEYRRIPWIWRVAIAAGKRNRPDEIRAILDVSLPKKGQPLRDWQAVVVGGGIINGVSMAHGWPEPLIIAAIGKDTALKERWTAAIEFSVAMSDNEKVPTGTRYDALRMVAMFGWDKSKTLVKYLDKGVNAELQMGAVSGIADVEHKQASRFLALALGYLTGQNRKLAISGLLRSEDRALGLLEAIQDGSATVRDLSEEQYLQLKQSKWKSVQKRAGEVLSKP